MDFTILKTLRKAKGINQEELGKRVGVSGAYISKLERNLKTKSDEVLENICKELGCEFRIILNLTSQ